MQQAENKAANTIFSVRWASCVLQAVGMQFFAYRQPANCIAMNYHAAKAFILDKLECELSDKLTYHGLHHTLDVLYTTEELCYIEKVPPYEAMLLKTAALFHDAGFTVSNKEHEALGCALVRSHLPNYDYTPREVEHICDMIMATKIPQSPRNPLEQILCDADLDYLGRDDFYAIGATLFEELKTYNVLQTEESWNRLQVSFLEKHAYFTRTNHRRRAPRKQRYLEELRTIVAGYEKKE
jgi:HD superfamily phosphodiesterase